MLWYIWCIPDILMKQWSQYKYGLTYTLSPRLSVGGGGLSVSGDKARLDHSGRQSPAPNLRVDEYTFKKHPLYSCSGYILQ